MADRPSSQRMEILQDKSTILKIHELILLPPWKSYDPSKLKEKMKFDQILS